MNKELKKLVGKLNKKHGKFIFTHKATLNFLEDREDGKCFGVAAQLTILGEAVHPTTNMPVPDIEVNGIAYGASLEEAFEQAQINCINLVNIF